jgi:Zn-dependent protease with chaperone function
MTALRFWAGWLVWPLAVLVVLGHLGLGVLAAVEYARLDWLFSEPYELTAVTVVAGSAALALVGGLRVVWPAVRGGRALRRLLSTAGRPLPAPVRGVAESLGIADRVDVVGTGEAFAVTHGLVRPRILLSAGLVDALDAAELTSVLVHERHHLWRRDPLRLLAAGSWPATAGSCLCCGCGHSGWRCGVSWPPTGPRPRVPGWRRWPGRC